MALPNSCQFWAVLCVVLSLFSVNGVTSENLEKVLDYRFVSYEDLLPSLEQFFDPDSNGQVGHFEQLLFDLPHHQLIVGKEKFLLIIL